MKHPVGSTPSSPEDARPRAQVSYEGEDEFSAMSLDPRRKEVSKGQAQLQPNGGAKQEVQVDKLKTTNDHGLFGVLRRIFAK